MDRSRLKWIVRYLLKVVPILVVAGALVWFFFLRQPSSESAEPTKATKPTNVAVTKSSTKPSNNSPKTNGAQTTAPSTSAKSTSSTSTTLPSTGPADSAVVFVLGAAAGTVLWEWRLRRARQ